MGPILLIILYSFYSLLVLMLRRILVEKSSGIADGVADYLTLISLVIPVFGLIGSVLVWQAACKVDETDLLDYEETLRFDVMPYEELRREAAYSKNVMPIALSIESNQQDVSRELIIRQLHLLSSGQGAYLKKAVRGAAARPELAHYASTTFHLLNDRHLKAIQAIEEQPAADEKERAVALYEAYHAYWRSDLLTGKEQERLAQKQRVLLERLIELEPDDPFAYEALGELFAAIDKNSRTILVHYRKAVFRFPDIVSFQENLARHLLYQNNWKDAARVVTRLEERDMLEKTSNTFQEVIQSLWALKVSS